MIDLSNIPKWKLEAIDKVLMNQKRLIPENAMKRYVANQRSEEDSVDADNGILYIDGAIIPDDYARYYAKQGINSYVSSAIFRERLAKIDAEHVIINANTPGGSVTEGAGIHRQLVDLRNDGRTYELNVHGLLASAGTYLIFNAKEVSVGDLDAVMIHDTLSFLFLFAYGNADELEAELKEGQKTVDVLRSYDAKMVKMYARYTGETEKKIRGIMKDETFFIGQDAVDAKLATTFVEARDDDDDDDDEGDKDAKNEYIDVTPFDNSQYILL